MSRRQDAASNEPCPESVTQAGSSLASEFDRLRECETNLRDYETRLREWQERLDRGERSVVPAIPSARCAGNSAPLVEDPDLRAAWQKLFRARELIDAEQDHLRDDRISAQGREAEIKRREKAIEQRELKMAERERVVSEAQAALAAAPAPLRSISKLERFSNAPFAIAKAVFSGGR